jgi:hypothetical protein
MPLLKFDWFKILADRRVNESTCAKPQRPRTVRHGAPR